MMQHLESLALSEGNLRENSMLNLGLNHSNLGDDSINWLVFIKFNLQD